ncbi:MAG: polysaccharide biosynthesis/export family protein [Candidatus Pedobacter colombiensis]|uniref:Polysaccharide biosynthesis/export family protein n=1 Tax=Candidatus Pedobacter colombiensis TaxID=3121371 RepID=A0AAJ5WBG9_9SPHI|nr:polysaccharide biosynthesis/export family protein [Pedobacter sp.]WEK19707.1 MAG: polysaccharide biosynthesis/export family protein [Pedobacter sp.]
MSILFASFSCSNRQKQALFENKSAINTTQNNGYNPPDYLIKPEDLLQIKNLQNRNLIVNEPITKEKEGSNNNTGQTYRVEQDSTIGLPILGRVKVGGLTRRGAANQIEMLYRRELKDPIIELKIINLKVTLLGEVKNQGTYNLLKDHTSLVEVIGEAGGLTDKANSKNIKIIRGGMQTQQVIDLDLTDLRTLSDSRTMLQNNDIIYVAQNKRAIRSEKLQTMSAILQPVIALLNTALLIYTITR